MKLWVDDLRPPPDDSWHWSKTPGWAMFWLDFHLGDGFPIEVMSLDHDLGGEATSRPIVLWMCETGLWPDEVVVHSANPVGRGWLEGMIERYKPENVDG